MAPLLLAVVVAALAVARLARLAVVDEIAAPARNAVLRRLDAENAFHLKIAYLLSCQWCAAVWVAGPAAAAVAAWPAYLLEATPTAGRLVWVLLTVLALGQVAGMLSDVRFYLRNRS